MLQIPFVHHSFSVVRLTLGRIWEWRCRWRGWACRVYLCATLLPWQLCHFASCCQWMCVFALLHCGQHLALYSFLVLKHMSLLWFAFFKLLMQLNVFQLFTGYFLKPKLFVPFPIFSFGLKDLFIRHIIFYIYWLYFFSLPLKWLLSYFF